MAKKADLGSKRLISLAPNPWVQWVTQQPDVQVQEFLSSEFQWIGRENDVLLKVYRPKQGEFLVLNEIQLRYSSRMPQRIRAYAALAEERYNLPVYPVLINILPNSKIQVVPEFYQSDFLGIPAYQGYRVINLWEVDVNLVFEQGLSSLLPFVPILKGGGEETVVQQIMRWDMTVLRESPWYQEILKEGLEKGERQGLQQGLQQGEVTLIIRQLARRFGTVEPSLEEQIRQLSVPQLEALGESLLDFSTPKDLLSWLEQRG
jgi:predicted transposase YdaD